MALLAQLTDPHLKVGGGDRGAAADLARVVDAVVRLPQAPDAVVVTGDLTDSGTPAEYERVRELLAPLPAPVHVLPGNHDDRDALRAAFGLAGDGPVRYAAPCGALRLVVCDTTIPGEPGGSLDAERLGWLEGVLAEDPTTPTIIAVHHPPVATGIPVMDEIGVPAGDTQALAALLRRSPQVRRVVTGHGHRTAFGVLGGCPVFACGSTEAALRLDFQATDFDVVRDPPVFAVHALVGDELVTHVQPVAGPHPA